MNKVSVTEKSLVTDDICILKLAIYADIRFKAGQAFGLEIPGKPLRSYSTASVPGDPTLDFHIKKGNPQGLSAYIYDTDISAVTFQLSASFGTTVLNTRCKKPIIAIAGGTGLGQIIGIVKAALATDRQNPIYLYHGGRSFNDLYMHKTLSEMAAQDERLIYKPALSENTAEGIPSGLVHDVVAKDFEDLSGFRSYISGPAAMVAATQNLLLSKKIDPKRIHFDKWN